jgi:hypothetical protein
MLRDNGLSLVLALLFVGSFAGQTIAGYRHYNNEQREHAQATLSPTAYLTSPHFYEATAENWESEFLQLFGYVILTAVLFQRGSSESKDPDKPEPVDRDPRRSRDKPGVPGPVRRGGWVLALYEHSLSLTFLVLFLGAFVLHAASGAREFNADAAAHDDPTRVSLGTYMTTARFWFESFQNWQSEFLALFAMVVLSIFLRERGSPESKPVDTPHHETGE